MNGADRLNSNAGEVVSLIRAAVLEHGATPLTEVRIRIGPGGPEHKIAKLVACKDQRGFSLVLEANLFPERG